MPADAALAVRDADGELDRLVTLGELEEITGFTLRIAQLTTFERLFALCAPGEMNLSKLTVLYAIWRNPDVRQGVLADLLKIKWPNMTKLVRSLEDDGLVERHVPKTDRRAVVLRLTEQGARAVENFAVDMRRSDRMALSMLDDDEYMQLLGLCRKIAGWVAEPATKRNAK